MSILFYKRPQYVQKPSGRLDAVKRQAYINQNQKYDLAIPPELSFEQVVGNKAAPVRIRSPFAPDIG